VIDLPLDRIREMLRELRKVTTVFRLYGAQHPETRRAAEDLDAILMPLLEDLGRLDLDIHAEQLMVGDKTVFEDDASTSFTESLYMEGVQRLTFLPGVEPDEILELIRLLSLNLNLPGFEEETLISLLWQSDLPHIQYEAVEGLVEAVEQSESAASGEAGVFGDVLNYVLSTRADALDDLPPIMIPGAEQLAADDLGDMGDALLTTMEGTYETVNGRGDWVVEMDDDSVEESASIEIEVPASYDPEDKPEHYRQDTAREPDKFGHDVIQAAQAAGLQEPLDWGVQRQSATIDTLRWAEGNREELGVPAEEIAAYWQSVEDDNYESILRQVLEVLLFLVAHPNRALEQDDVDELCRQGMQSVLDQRLLRVYLSTLEMLEMLIGEGEFAERVAELEALRDRWTNHEALEQVCRMMPRQGPETEQLAEFIERGGTERAVVIRDLLSTVRGERRERLIEAVVRATRHDPAALGENLSHLSIEQLQVALTCIACIYHPSMTRSLERSLRHPSPDVRMHVLSLLDDERRAKGWKNIAPLVSDKDGAVRVAALQALKGITDPGLEQLLRGELEPARFKGRQPAEQQALASCYARAGKERAIPALKAILEGKRWSLMSSVERTDLEAALWGLVAVGTPEARAIVKQAAKSMLPGLKRAAQTVLEQMGLDVD